MTAGGDVRAREDGPGFAPGEVVRPDPALLRYYLWTSVPALVAFPAVFLPLWFKYRTLEYRFDEEGVSMAWGRFFRKEIYLTYRRIQDIHVTRNILHRWLGLARLSLQTASGSAGAEMTIEGIRRPERLRDFLYARMRGARDEAAEEGSGPGAAGAAGEDEALALLREIRDALRALAPPDGPGARGGSGAAGPSPGPGGPHGPGSGRA